MPLLQTDLAAAARLVNSGIMGSALGAMGGGAGMVGSTNTFTLSNNASMSNSFNAAQLLQR
jgi:hypothetical protein